MKKNLNDTVCLSFSLELGFIPQDIGSLGDENKIQNMDIDLLKEINQSQDKRTHQKIIEELDQRMKYYDESSLVQENQYSSGSVKGIVPSEMDLLD